jgi:hypothetical protein
VSRGVGFEASIQSLYLAEKGEQAGLDGGPRLARSDSGGGPRPPDLKASEEPEWCPAKHVKHTKGGDALRAPTSSRASCEASKAVSAEGASQAAAPLEGWT